MHSARGENNGNDEAVKSDTFGEDHHENDSDQNVSVLHAIDARLTAKSNRESGGHRGEANRKSSTKVLIAQVIVVSPSLWICNCIRKGLVDYKYNDS